MGFIYHGNTSKVIGDPADALVEARLLEPKELLPNAYFGVKMPENWTPMFDLSDPEKVRRTNELEERQLDRIIQRIQDREKGDFMRGKVPRVAARTYDTHYEAMRKTVHFHVTEDCIGCGLCAGQCPAGAIAMKQRRPIWTKPQCIMCLGCLHHCPGFAIQYGGGTKDHGQYTHPGGRRKNQRKKLCIFSVMPA